MQASSRFFLFSLIITLLSCGGSQQLSSIEYKSRYKLDGAISNKFEQSDKPWRFQQAATDYANKGNYAASLKMYDLENEIGGPVTMDHSKDSLEFYKKYRPVNAIKQIVSAAKNYQVVIINEAHHNPQNRVFTRQLLSKLRAQGFGHLGLETLSHNDKQINQRGYPVFASGPYVKEPQFGNLIREALAQGYQLFPYEAGMGKNGKSREVEQAKNIAQYLEDHPGAKVLIHCGYAHAYKGPYKSWEKAMAGRLEEYTGITPLTIDQQVFREKSAQIYEEDGFRFVHVEQPTIFLDGQGKSFPHPENPNYVDFVVLNSRTKYIDGRPHWIFDETYKKVEIKLRYLDIEGPFIAAAYREGEDIERAVPVDVYEPQLPAKKLTLSLKPGKYSIVLIGEKQSWVFKKEVE